MRLSPFYVTFAIVTATAWPLHHVSLNERDLVTFINNAADQIRNTVDDAIPAVSRALMQISKTAAGALPNIARRAFDLPDDFIANIPPEVFANGTVGNAALWEEAVSIDTRLNAGNLNQIFYRLISYLQKIENGSVDALAGVGSGVSYIGQGLQFLHIYPGQFDQAQAALPAETLGRYPCDCLGYIH